MQLNDAMVSAWYVDGGDARDAPGDMRRMWADDFFGKSTSCVKLFCLILDQQN
jgi:hypothetical protein